MTKLNILQQLIMKKNKRMLLKCINIWKEIKDSSKENIMIYFVLVLVTFIQKLKVELFS